MSYWLPPATSSVEQIKEREEYKGNPHFPSIYQHTRRAAPSFSLEGKLIQILGTAEGVYLSPTPPFSHTLRLPSPLSPYPATQHPVTAPSLPILHLIPPSVP